MSLSPYVAALSADGGGSRPPVPAAVPVVVRLPGLALALIGAWVGAGVGSPWLGAVVFGVLGVLGAGVVGRQVVRVGLG